MTYEEARKALYSVVPWVSLNRFPEVGEIYVSLEGDFDVEDLKRLIEIIESVELT